jgi:hypothetical protein
LKKLSIENRLFLLLACRLLISAFSFQLSKFLLLIFPFQLWAFSISAFLHSAFPISAFDFSIPALGFRFFC